MNNWTLFSNHGHVLVCLSRNSEARLRDVAADVGITERAVQKIVRDLQDGGMISVTKSGRRNCYRIHKKQTLRHNLEANCSLRDLIRVLNQGTDTAQSAADSDNVSQRDVQSKPEPIESAVETGLVSAKKSDSIKSKAIKATPEKTKTKDSNPPGSLEKQQGTLF